MTLTWIALLAACGGGAPEPAAEPEPAPAEVPAEPEAPPIEVPAKHKALFQTVSTRSVKPSEHGLVDLGRMLYHEPRLSKSQTISCNSCHVLTEYGVDGEPTSPGHEGQRGGRNSPTVFHAAGHLAQFWDGRAPDVEEQAKGPILNPIEMAMPSADAVVAVLETIPGYQTAFAKAFPSQASPITYDNLAKAIGAFERHLITPSRFDAYLNGDGAALSETERAGVDVFIATGCASCHNGPLLGGSSYQKLGAVTPYETDDVGRKAVTGKAADLHVFKVPSLRNIAKTGPYFHDGSVGTLDEAVRLMAKHQLGKELGDEDVASIVAFLGSLTGEIDAAYVATPDLPDSGPNTPGPG